MPYREHPQYPVQYPSTQSRKEASMNVKAFAAIVGTLSLGALATGCASNKAAEGSTTEASGAQASCGGDKAATGTQAACSGEKAAPTEQKGEAGSCGGASCSGKK